MQLLLNMTDLWQSMKLKTFEFEPKEVVCVKRLNGSSGTVPLDSPFRNGMTPGNRGVFFPPSSKRWHPYKLSQETQMNLNVLKASSYPLILVQTGVKIYIANTEQ